ncbi:somatostatin receptor type 2-like [Prorops nasuta]|uniref:somatostatin receptor type 2-like n=1 Tax=Prorops nasuta TaxID=863751 RepID=UPI0034CE2FA5
MSTEMLTVLSAQNESFNDTSLMMENMCQADLPVMKIIAIVLFTVVWIIGVLGNGLVIYVVLRFPIMHTTTNIYIVNLAIADECFLIGIPLLVVTTLYENWIFGKHMCILFMVMTSINQFTSSIFLVIMSFDRYIAVVHPIIGNKIRTRCMAKIVSISCWVISIVIMTPIIMYADVHTRDNVTYNCNILWPGDNDYGGEKIVMMYNFTLGYVLPILLISVFYIQVLRQLQTVSSRENSAVKKSTVNKVTWLVLTVIIVYGGCWLPYWITQVSLVYMNPKECQSQLFISTFLLAGVLAYSNSAMNPILYAFLSENFKQSFLRACGCAVGPEVNATHHDNRTHPDHPPCNQALINDDNAEQTNFLASRTSSTTVTLPLKDHKFSLKNGNQQTLFTPV